MNTAEFSIKKDVFIWSIVFIIILAGISVYFFIGKLEDPEFTIHTSVVTTYLPGANQYEVEKYVSNVLEENIQEIKDIDEIVSYSQNGVSYLYVRIKEEINGDILKDRWYDMRKKISDISYLLPESIKGPFINDEFGDVFGIVLNITGDGFSYNELENITEKIKKRLLQIDLVNKVNILGKQKKQYNIVLSNSKLAQYNMSIYEIIKILKSQNIIFPSGNAHTKQDIVRLDVSGSYKNINQLENTVVKSFKNNASVKLKDIAEISFGYKENPNSIIRRNGKAGMGIAINIIENGNVIKLGNLVKDEIQKLEQQLPVGINIELVNFQPENVSRSVNRFIINLFESVSIVIAVLLLFLGLKTGLIVGIGLPLTILSTFIFMYLYNIDLQMVSLGALIIALGMLVDNSIVVTELIMVKMQNGIERIKACKDAVTETYIPLLSSTLIACAVFLAIPLSKSMTGEYTLSLFQVVSSSLLISWLLSITVTPLMCYRWLKVKRVSADDLYSSDFYVKYKKILNKLLNNPYNTLGIIFILFISSIILFKELPVSFFPDSERNTLIVDFWLPQGTTIQHTEKEVVRLEKELSKYKEINNVTSYIGTGSPRFYLTLEPKLPQSYYAQILLDMKSKKSSKKYIKQIYELGYKKFSNARLRVYRLPLGPYSENSVEFRIRGEDPQILKKISEKIKTILNKNPYTIDPIDNWREKVKKINIQVNQYKAKELGISTNDISLSLFGAVDGIEISKLRDPEDLIPITIRSPDSERYNIERLKNIYIVSSTTGIKVPLSSIAKVSYAWEENRICRLNNEYFIEVGCKTYGALPQEVLNDVLPQIQKIEIPNNFTFEITGEYKKNKDANKKISKPLPAILIIIFLILIYQFNSFKRSLIIIITVSLGIIGVVAGLFLTRQSFGFMCMLGMISLSGMIIKNSIVIIDRIQYDTEKGIPLREAIIESAISRLRPVLLAAFTTVLGMLPLALTPDGLFTSMAIAIVSGLTFATILTLGVVPILYWILFNQKD